MLDLSFYKGKKVFLTGHTGFKGAWMSRVLLLAGAELSGYALEPPTSPALFDLLGLSGEMNSYQGDIRDLERLSCVMESVSPEIVIHLAAQPLVRRSYREPVYTYETNVMGTVNICECLRRQAGKGIKSFLNVTTDKVYENREWDWGYRETDTLDGYDPYSNSKSCSELVTNSYRKSFLEEEGIAVSTARGGNVIGGGDFAVDRLIPDCIRAAQENKDIIIRNPHMIRPFQHVLELVMAYLMIAERQYIDRGYAGSYNVGPDEADCVTASRMADYFVKYWGENLTWKKESDGGPHEAGFLKLDCSRIRHKFHWHPTWTIERGVQETVIWTKAWRDKKDVRKVMDAQIKKFYHEMKGIEYV